MVDPTFFVRTPNAFGNASKLVDIYNAARSLRRVLGCLPEGDNANRNLRTVRRASHERGS